MKQKIRYCKRCLLPSTKPYIKFDEEGVCQACLAHEEKHAALGKIDWGKRKRQFYDLVESAKAQNAPWYDALVPVSGGKDSITQVHRLLGHGLRILAVNVDYGIKTEIGKENLACIPEMGANLIIYRPQLDLHIKLIKLGLEEYGDPDLLSHTLLHAAPLHIALRFQIPLVMLGENSAEEYSGETGEASAPGMTREWFTRYAANAGRDARYIAKKHDIPFEQLRLYDFPDEIVDSSTHTYFMSHFFQWDSEKHLEIAKSYGFKTLDQPGEGTYRNFVGIDEKINRIHQYLKVLKFGYGRATDHACEDIRNGRLTREQAKELVREHDLKPLSVDYTSSFAEFVGYSEDEIRELLEKFRDQNIWGKKEDGSWIIANHLEEATEMVRS
ncbi:N-acetyl sugar amidotransferase [bacterium]|nr:N-acetyl sugar amidotransferase [bacterium]